MYVSASISVFWQESMRSYRFLSLRKMAAYRASLKSRFFDEENTCMSCFDNTKYFCLICQDPICNKCSIFERDEQTSGWIAGKSVGYCDPCHNEFQQGAKAKGTKQSSNYDTEELEAGQNSPPNSGRYVHH